MSGVHSSTLREQSESIARHNALRGQQQLAAWKHAAGIGGHVDPKFRFISLLEEALRHEVNSIRSGRSSRPHQVSDPELLISDLRASYRLLIAEARRLFDERRANGGLSDEELWTVSSQAASSFASMYPWSDGVTCRDLTMDHPHFMPLASHGMITAGVSGVITLKSFVASMLCAEVKQEAAMQRRQARIEEYYRERDAIQQQKAQHQCMQQLHGTCAADYHAATVQDDTTIHHDDVPLPTRCATDTAAAASPPDSGDDDPTTPAVYQKTCITASGTPRAKPSRVGRSLCGRRSNARRHHRGHRIDRAQVSAL